MSSEWIGVIGAAIGAALGGIISAVITTITNRHNAREAEKERIERRHQAQAALLVEQIEADIRVITASIDYICAVAMDMEVWIKNPTNEDIFQKLRSEAAQLRQVRAQAAWRSLSLPPELSQYYLEIDNLLLEQTNFQNEEDLNAAHVAKYSMEILKTAGKFREASREYLARQRAGISM